MKLCFDGKITESFQEHLNRNGLIESTIGEAQLYYPSGKGSVKKLKAQIEATPDKKFCQIVGAEFLAAKHFLWIKNITKLGLQGSLDFLPMTFVLSSKADLQKLDVYCKKNPERQMILKGSKQKRKGLALVKANEIGQHNLSEYLVAQEVLETSKILSERAYNFRSYMMVSLSHGELSFQLYKNAKFVYAETGEIITQNDVVATDAEAKWLDEKIEYLEIYMEQLNEILVKITKNITSDIQSFFTENKYEAHQLTGFDFLIDSNERVRILEFNMRPEMSDNDPKGQKLKNAIMDEYFRLFSGESLGDNWLQIASEQLS